MRSPFLPPSKEKKMIHNGVIIPTEHQEQKAVVEWALWHELQHPELKMLFAIPNGTYKSKAASGMFKAEGLKKGVPDLMLAVARKGYHGLFIEMKRLKGGVVSKEQVWWLNALSEQGYRVATCRGYDQAINIIKDYLEIE